MFRENDLLASGVVIVGVVVMAKIVTDAGKLAGRAHILLILQ